MSGKRDKARRRAQRQTVPATPVDLIVGPGAPRRVDPPVRPGNRVVACVGDRWVHGTLSEYRRDGGDLLVAIDVSSVELADAPIDAAAPMRVWTGSTTPAPPASVVIFTGHITAFETIEDGARIRAGAMVPWKEQRTGGLAMLGVSAPEGVWSMARMAGLDPAQIDVMADQKWTPTAEPMLVVAPISGIQIDEPLALGVVTLVSDASFMKGWRLDSAPWIEEFRGAGAWAITDVVEAFVLEAEAAGFRRIVQAIDRLALTTRYSFSTGPDGRIRSFARGQLGETLQVIPIVGVHGLKSGRLWLRGLVDPGLAFIASAETRSALHAIADAPVDLRLEEAIGAWRRATKAVDPASAMVAMGESLEFYVAGTDVPELFSEDERSKIRVALEGFWLDDQSQRLEQLVGWLNDAPFMVRLNVALARDRLELSEDERDLLGQIRSARNDILHGKGRTLIDRNTLQRALALVDRILVFRLHALATRKPADSPSEGG